MGRGHRLAALLHSAAALILSNTHIRNSLGAARQRHDLFDAYAAGYSGDSTREAASAAVSHCARDQRQHWQRRHTRWQSAKHDHWSFLAYSLFAIFANAGASGDHWTSDQFHNFAFRFPVRFAISSHRTRSSCRAETRSRFICNRVHRVLVDLCLLCRWVEPGMDGTLGRGAGDGARASRHARSPQADRLALTYIFRRALYCCRWIERYRFARCDLSTFATCLRIKRDNADLEPRMVLRGRFESFLERSVCSRRREMDRALYRSRADVES